MLLEENAQSQWRQECIVGSGHGSTDLRAGCGALTSSIKPASFRRLSKRCHHRVCFLCLSSCAVPPYTPRCNTAHATYTPHHAPEREGTKTALSPLQHGIHRHTTRSPTDVFSLGSLLARSMLFSKRHHNGTSRGCSLLKPKSTIRQQSMAGSLLV